MKAKAPKTQREYRTPSMIARVSGTQPGRGFPRRCTTPGFGFFLTRVTRNPPSGMRCCGFLEGSILCHFQKLLNLCQPRSVDLL